MDSVQDLRESLIDGCIKPYYKMIEIQNVENIIAELFNLLDKHRDCPSIVSDKQDSESLSLRSVRNILAKIPLKDHSYAVAINLVDLIKKSYPDYDSHIPMAIIAGLAHDIGKIPELRLSGTYNSYEHHIVSACRLMEMFPDKEAYIAKKIINAVQNHHTYSEDNFTVLLKNADKEARSIELAKLTANYRIASIESWFDIDTFYIRIKSRINYARDYKHWAAFSFRGWIYCKPDYIYKTAKALCDEANVLDIAFIDDSENESATRRIVNELKKHDLIPNYFHYKTFRQKYEIKFLNGLKWKEKLIPLRPANFYNMREIESRKIGFLEIIESVQPCGRLSRDCPDIT